MKLVNINDEVLEVIYCRYVYLHMTCLTMWYIWYSYVCTGRYILAAPLHEPIITKYRQTITRLEKNHTSMGI